jgi:hypothetical protein
MATRKSVQLKGIFLQGNFQTVPDGLTVTLSNPRQSLPRLAFNAA